ncbi:MAG: Nif3-like dinuclear metal center hexameric protein [Deltaproteobacteria bacterium]|jgi:dinuclear metal center YbgI/SA1388 family protein|nr:Nif3-like dinuclear metal center hexameric protein [Deltaproteobacteria bacterium]
MQLNELIDIIEQTALPFLAAPWDHSGIQVAACNDQVRHMAVMLDPTLDNIQLALDRGADFILAHHPLSLRPRFPDTTDNYHRILSLLFKNDVCLYSAHTSLDSNPNGPAAWLADSFNLTDRAVLEVTGVLPGEAGLPAGFGFVGNLPNLMAYTEFCAKLSLILEINAWRCCGPTPSLVRRIACCPGSGADAIEVAEKAGADVYITGDVKYHAALDAQIRVLDVGHFQLEEMMMHLFAEQLGRQSPEIMVSFITGTDPLFFWPVLNTASVF